MSGDYKILTGTRWSAPRCGETGCLYNIRNDPEEHVNLAKNMPDMLKSMQKKLLSYRATRFEPDRGDKWPGACDAALNKYGGFWGPFLN